MNICFLQFILTGCFPFCMTQRRQSRWRCLKKTFMVCNIVAASLFVPTVLSLGVFGTIARANPEEHRIDVVVLSSFIAVLGIIELVISIAAASFCCCCTLWDDTDRSVVYITSGQPTHIVGMPDSHIIQSGPGQDGSAMRCGIYPAGDMTQQFQVPKPHFAEAELGQQFNRQTLPPYKI
ncbi:uncharacterized protein LOC143083574 isoform X2 [Mytilus galloprovincialis]|uniref:uncharacterized protein LOC143083574 isoform X2 n=1 Tax=Mytilus galloprovincialis TaxID=29158 RepID=UPI003F7C877F